MLLKCLFKFQFKTLLSEAAQSHFFGEKVDFWYFLVFFLYNEPELGAGIDPGMALTPLSSSIGQGSNPRPSMCSTARPQLSYIFGTLFTLCMARDNTVQRALCQGYIRSGYVRFDP